MDGHSQVRSLFQIPRRAWSGWFQGPAAVPEPFSWPIFALVALTAGLLLLTRLSLPLLEPEETRYAEIARQMLAGGHFVEPVWHCEPYYHKPPLYYWLLMLSYTLFGVGDGPARLVPALAALALVGVVYGWAWRALGRRSALVAALLLCLSARCLFLSRMLVLDGLLSLWVTSGLACGHLALREGQLRWSWWFASSSACGFGVLTKGPVAVILVATPLLLYGWLDPRSARLSMRSGLAFVAGLFLVAGPWFVVVAVRAPDAVNAFFFQHNVERFLQPFDHAEPLWFFVPGLLIALFPGSLLLIPLGRALLSRHLPWAGLRSEALGFMLLAFLSSFCFFSLSGCKRPVYVLPCLPLFALLLTGGFTVIAPKTRTGFARWGIGSGLLFIVLFVGLREWLPDYHRHFGMRGQVRRFRHRETLPVLCYPRRWDSVSYYLERADVRVFGPDDRDAMTAFLCCHNETLVFVKNQVHLENFRRTLPPELQFVPDGRVGRNVTAGLVRRRLDLWLEATARR